MAERESSTYLVWRNEKAPLHARESGLMCGKWTDTGAKATNVSRGFELSPPGGGFEPKTFVYRVLSLPLGQGSCGI